MSIPGHEAAAQAIQADLDRQLADFTADAAALAELRREDEFFDGEYYQEGVFTLTRADSGLISFQFCGSTYSGGAHGSTNYVGCTYDTATGQRLTLSYLGEGVKDAAAEVCLSLAEQVAADREGFFFAEYRDGVASSVVTDDTFWMTDRGIIFADNEYVLQPYAAGMLAFFVPYGELGEGLNPAYALAGQAGDAASVTLGDGSVYSLPAE